MIRKLFVNSNAQEKALAIVMLLLKPGIHFFNLISNDQRVPKGSATVILFSL